VDDCEKDQKYTGERNFALVGPDGIIQARVQSHIQGLCGSPPPDRNYNVDCPLACMQNQGVVPPTTTNLKMVYLGPTFKSLCAMLGMQHEGQYARDSQCSEYMDAPRDIDFYTKGPKLTYDFETGTVSNESGHVFKNGVRVE